MKYIFIAFVAVFLLSCQKDEAPKPQSQSFQSDTLGDCKVVPSGPLGKNIYVTLYAKDTITPMYKYYSDQDENGNVSSGYEKIIFTKTCDKYYHSVVRCTYKFDGWMSVFIKRNDDEKSYSADFSDPQIVLPF